MIFFFKFNHPIDKKRVLGFLQAIFNFREDERSDFLMVICSAGKVGNYPFGLRSRF